MVKARNRQEYKNRDQIQIRRALISVSDKTGLVELAQQLAENGVELISTGSTAQKIKDAGLAVTQVSEVTGFPESLDGRVKTLHPAVHAGLLADLRLAAHQQQLHDLGIAPFELVVVNLYPFQETVASGADAANVIENIDIGGPAMVRASAKNFQNVVIAVDPADYDLIMDQVVSGGTNLKFREQLARKAFAHTAAYDAAVSGWFEEQAAATAEADHGEAVPTPVAGGIVAGAAATMKTVTAEAGFSASRTLSLQLATSLRYGENSHQQAALYLDPTQSGIAQATQHGGKEMSYNNYVDADAALRAAYDFDEPAVAIIKHTNPCGVAVADTIAQAHEKAHATDPLSAFGGVIAANRTITKEAAEQIAPIFTEVIVAPGYEPEALEVLQQKKNLRILELAEGFRSPAEDLRQISGGFLAQEADAFQAEGDKTENWTLVSGEAASAEDLADLAFAWRAVRAVKSNAILLAKDQAAVGIGMGQVNRVDSCQLAIGRAAERAKGSVAASDAFFPFSDGIETLIAAGVTAIVQPGGSVRDEEVIAAAKNAGITMYFTGTRHFFH